MAKPKFTYEDFLMEVSADNAEFVTSMNNYLTEQGCTIKIESAKSGYVVSYSLNGRALMNYVFRKSGMVSRIYGDFAHTYISDIVLTNDMQKGIKKAPVCKRLIDPAKCLQTCRMGYDFYLDGEQYQKCQYSAFMFLINTESKQSILDFIKHEVMARSAAQA